MLHDLFLENIPSLETPQNVSFRFFTSALHLSYEIFELNFEEEQQRLKANLDSYHSYKWSFSINVAGDYCTLITRQNKKKRNLIIQ